jgi:hypothetical protein
LPSNFQIAVKTDDTRFYHRLLKLVEGSHLSVKFFALNQPIPSQKYDLIVTSQNTVINSSDTQILRFKLDELHPDLITKIIGIAARKKEPKFKQLVIGIDPGENIGVAAICDGMILVADTKKLNQLVRKIEEYLILFPSERVVIRIGDQPTTTSEVIFNKLFDVFGKDKNTGNVELEIVNEAYSNPRKNTSNLPFGSDEAAAITIGLRKGIMKNHLVRSHITKGRIKEIQKWSRELSGNRLSLDVELAKAVALGELSLDEAIMLKEKELGDKKNE